MSTGAVPSASFKTVTLFVLPWFVSFFHSRCTIDVECTALPLYTKLHRFARALPPPPPIHMSAIAVGNEAGDLAMSSFQIVNTAFVLPVAFEGKCVQAAHRQCSSPSDLPPPNLLPVHGSSVSLASDGTCQARVENGAVVFRLFASPSSTVHELVEDMMQTLELSPEAWPSSVTHAVITLDSTTSSSGHLQFRTGSPFM